MQQVCDAPAELKHRKMNGIYWKRDHSQEPEQPRALLAGFHSGGEKNAPSSQAHRCWAGSRCRRFRTCGSDCQVMPLRAQPLAVRVTGRMPSRSSPTESAAAARVVGPFQRCAVRGSASRACTCIASAVAPSGSGVAAMRSPSRSSSASRHASDPLTAPRCHGPPTAGASALFADPEFSRDTPPRHAHERRAAQDLRIRERGTRAEAAQAGPARRTGPPVASRRPTRSTSSRAASCARNSAASAWARWR